MFEIIFVSNRSDEFFLASSGWSKPGLFPPAQIMNFGVTKIMVEGSKELKYRLRLIGKLKFCIPTNS